MDSVNSGSLQSSSGGDEEYDSRAESISAFLNHPSSHVGPLPNPSQPPPAPHLAQPDHHHTQTSSFMCDPLISNYFEQGFSRSPQLSNYPNSLLNLDTVWSKTLRSDADLGHLMASSASPNIQPFSSSSHQGQSSNFGQMQFPQVVVPENGGRDQNHQTSSNNNNNTVRSNSKKRSRASRRAPTTVLTTDTTNFRAMVQEFTGIPAPPFTSSPFPRSRLDLFGTAASTIRSAPLHFDNNTTPSSSYLLRPFAQKVQPLLPFPSTITTTNITSSPSNYHPPQNLLNNPILTFQSILQTTPPRYPPITSKPQGSSLEMGVLNDQYGLTNIVSSDGMASKRDENNNTWVDRGGSNSNNRDDDQGLFRSVNGNYLRSQNGGKFNYSASSSDFLGDKGPPENNVSTRTSEGMVESWICSSD